VALTTTKGAASYGSERRYTAPGTTVSDLRGRVDGRDGLSGPRHCRSR